VGRSKSAMVLGICLALTITVCGADKAPLVLLQTIPLPSLHDGDFDHLAVSPEDSLLFVAAEDNSKVEIFDLRANKLVHTITDARAPHAMVYRGDLKKLFVVDDSTGIRIYEGESYKATGSIKLRDAADSMIYDPATQYMYVVNGGKEAYMQYSFISVIDTNRAKQLADFKIESDSVEAMAIEKSGPRLFANLTGKSAVGVIDRNKGTVIANWPLGQEAKSNTAMAFDETGHRLFIGTRKPAKLIVLDSDSGKVLTSLPCVDMADYMTFDPALKRIYVSGSEFTDVFQQRDSDHYVLIGNIPGGFRAKTAVLAPELNRYYVAVPRYWGKTAGLRIYQVLP